MFPSTVSQKDVPTLQLGEWAHLVNNRVTCLELELRRKL